MLFGGAQADRTHRILLGAFGEHEHMQTIADPAQRHEPDFTIIEAIVLALQRRDPVKPFRSP